MQCTNTKKVHHFLGLCTHIDVKCGIPCHGVAKGALWGPICSLARLHAVQTTNPLPGPKLLQATASNR